LGLLQSAGALLTACPEPSPAAIAEGIPSSVMAARVRACAGALARVASDLLAGRQLRAHALSEAVAPPPHPQGESTPTPRELWRITVVDLANAMQQGHEARIAAEADPLYTALAAIVRQVLARADALSEALEAERPRDHPQAAQEGAWVALPPDVIPPPAPAANATLPPAAAAVGPADPGQAPDPSEGENPAESTGGTRRRRRWFGAETEVEDLWNR
jgi:hypothetical protein